MKDAELWRIKAPHFVCGIIIDVEGHVVEAAPIVAYMRTWGAERILSYCRRKRWTVEKPFGSVFDDKDAPRRHGH